MLPSLISAKIISELTVNQFRACFCSSLNFSFHQNTLFLEYAYYMITINGNILFHSAVVQASFRAAKLHDRNDLYCVLPTNGVNYCQISLLLWKLHLLAHCGMSNNAKSRFVVHVI